MQALISTFCMNRVRFYDKKSETANQREYVLLHIWMLDVKIFNCFNSTVRSISEVLCPYAVWDRCCSGLPNLAHRWDYEHYLVCCSNEQPGWRADVQKVPFVVVSNQLHILLCIWGCQCSIPWRNQSHTVSLYVRADSWTPGWTNGQMNVYSVRGDRMQPNYTYSITNEWRFLMIWIALTKIIYWYDESPCLVLIVCMIFTSWPPFV